MRPRVAQQHRPPASRQQAGPADPPAHLHDVQLPPVPPRRPPLPQQLEVPWPATGRRQHALAQGGAPRRQPVEAGVLGDGGEPRGLDGARHDRRRVHLSVSGRVRGGAAAPAAPGCWVEEGRRGARTGSRLVVRTGRRSHLCATAADLALNGRAASGGAPQPTQRPSCRAPRTPDHPRQAHPRRARRGRARAGGLASARGGGPPATRSPGLSAPAASPRAAATAARAAGRGRWRAPRGTRLTPRTPSWTVRTRRPPDCASWRGCSPPRTGRSPTRRRGRRGQCGLCGSG